ncbi:MAG: acyl carrier protein [Flavobacteriia bacterium]|nr:acyl carrier protein [Flavobacteriia bacterium]
MMDIDTFTRNLESEFEEVETGRLTPLTNYRDIPEFNSMYALIIIAFIDSEFDVLLTGEELRKTNTVKDLYELVRNKLQEKE